MSDTRNTTAESGGGLDPRQAAVLLDRTTLRAPSSSCSSSTPPKLPGGSTHEFCHD